MAAMDEPTPKPAEDHPLLTPKLTKSDVIRRHGISPDAPGFWSKLAALTREEMEALFPCERPEYVELVSYPEYLRRFPSHLPNHARTAQP